jgi:Rps23 Pro-64 3,4-dihydroxylase Tpa1-like proline 4-hydroxylase
MIVGSPSFSAQALVTYDLMSPVKNAGIATVLSDRLRFPEDVDSLRASWENAKPFKHIVLDDFFDAALLERVCREIPRIDDETWVRESDERIKQFNHRSPVSLGQGASELITLLHSAAFLYFLSEMTGVWELLPDPYLQGASYHVVPRGGFFHVHVDRNVAYSTGLVRRLALMLYLNKGWKPEYGGQFELWNETGTERVTSVEPVFNRCLIFEVTDTSYHGLPNPVACPPGQARNSFAVYYHTVGKAGGAEIKAHSSVYAPTSVRRKGFSVKDLAKDLTPPLLLRTARKLLSRSE